MKIYTKTGDKGTSALYNGERRSKDDPIFDLLGDIDELNAYIGYYKLPSNDTVLRMQSILLDIGANVATPRDTSPSYKIRKTMFDPGNVTWLRSLGVIKEPYEKIYDLCDDIDLKMIHMDIDDNVKLFMTELKSLFRCSEGISIESKSDMVDLCEMLESCELDDLKLVIELLKNQELIKSEDITWLEEQIDAMDEKLPPLTTFILPSHRLHIARTICRKTERNMVSLEIPEEVKIYMNRLSDYLFQLARYICHIENIEEHKWK